MTKLPPRATPPAPPSHSPSGHSPFLLFVLGGGVLLASGLVALRIGGGSVPVTWGEIFGWIARRPIDPTHAEVLGQIRLPRVLMAAIAGAALASAGVVYQALLRNPLADPYTLGVSGGATLGAVLAIVLAGRLGHNALLHGAPSVSACALAGAALSILFVYLLARSRGLFSTSALILAGVTLNLVFGSLILFLQYLADYTQIYQMIRWMMGGLDVVGYEDFRLLAPIVAAGLGVSFWFMRDLDPISVDPLAAAALGVPVERVRWIMLGASSLMVGAVVAQAGPIGFVGLIVPHCVRMAIGASHARTLPLSALAGALFLLACDTLSQNLIRGAELPVGVLTSMLGGPFFVWLLLSRRGRSAVWLD